MPEDEIPKDDQPQPEATEDGEVRERDAGIDQRTGGAGSNDETPREPQAGL
jgi:hypothetical protein